MKKEFVPYEQALALKELGFDETCAANYNNLTNETRLIFGETNKGSLTCNKVPGTNNIVKSNERILAPLYQQAFRWFREKSKLQAEILWRGDMECFCYKTGKFKYGSHEFSKDDYNTYEEAELECLKKLIEIVKNK
jgi:hypothetical protein